MSGALTQSPALQLLDIVWRGANRATEHSWERLNHAMRAALNLAVGAGLEFAESDFDSIRERLKVEHPALANPRYWPWPDGRSERDGESREMATYTVVGEPPAHPAPDPLRSPGDDELHRATGETRC